MTVVDHQQQRAAQSVQILDKLAGQVVGRQRDQPVQDLAGPHTSPRSGLLNRFDEMRTKIMQAVVHSFQATPGHIDCRCDRALVKPGDDRGCLAVPARSDDDRQRIAQGLV